MFARSHRFSFRKGVPKRIYSTAEFIIRYEENGTSKFTCAVVVGKKVDKRAVIRNGIKRKIVAIIRELVGDTAPYNVVIYARKPIGDADEGLHDKLKEAFKTIKIN